MSDTPKTPRGPSSAGGSGKAGKAGGANASPGEAAPPASSIPSDGGTTAPEVSPVSSDKAAPDTAVAGETAAPRTADTSTPPVPPPPASLNTPAKRFEPAILPIAAGLVVLGGAVAFLLSSPRERQASPGTVQQATAERAAAVDSRLAALEARPSAEGLADRAAAAERRVEALENTSRELAAKPVVDPEARTGISNLNGALEAARAASAEGLRRLEERAAALEGRIQEESRRAEARIAQAEATLANRLTGAEQALAARVTAAEQAFAPRLAALDAALNQRVEAAGQALNQRMDAAGRAMDERLSRAEQQMNERIGRQETALAERVQQFEQRLRQAEAAERRLGALAARGAIQTALDAGRPLGQALSGLSGTPPVALARYRDAAPPTEAALRLSFEEAARAARLAAEPQGQSVADSALARLEGLVTVRRGNQVVVGNAVAGELEQARRSLDAGDLSGAVERLEKLPEPSRQAMAGWIGQARDLVEARAALRDLGTAAPGAGTN
ncbi:mitofilin family membrane protein [Roseomonas xinghualingensis]|uniref:mitofilin family membrane protein n=1 Tax=Roseomonas xinghualingensis TaxID=2986475 RepID=UPI0021F0DF97|nr:mitofilin family membrane protein [Roseomonas sp. SXEYE001]MCV4207608.1 mitofilin family membrane protein [Roseomonas sp. SXEYE001]